MKFKDFKYERPNIIELGKNIEKLILKLRGANTFEEVKEVVFKINKIRNHIQTMSNLAMIRNTIDTRDEFYDGESEFWDENLPLVDEINNNFYEALLDSKFKEEISKFYGEPLIKGAEFAKKCFSKEIIEDMKLENKLQSRYQKLIASAKIKFDGEDRTLASLTPFVTSENRDVRKRASEAKFNFYVENEAEFDEIFDGLVQIRTKIAKKLGYKNFVELGYMRMNRFD